jgi:formylmethanofuran dehydrogenase subunit E
MITPVTATSQIETSGSRVTRALSELLDESAARHQHLCPRQVLGARMGLLGARLLGSDSPSAAKRLLVIVETDGCFADGLSVATGCTVGARMLRLIDHGKVAAVFVDTRTDQAVRLVPRQASRTLAYEYAPLARSPWHAQLEAYQIMPDAELFDVRPVELTLSLEKLLSKPGRKAICDQCGEEIINEREVKHGDRTLCRACAGDGCWRSLNHL